MGSWTLEKLALEGQGRDDKLPAGDLDYLKLVGRAACLGRRATESEVRDFFAPYAPYEGLAGTYALSAAHLAGARGPDRAREPPQVGQWGITRVGAPLNVQGGALRLTATAMCKEHLIGGLVRGSLPG